MKLEGSALLNPSHRKWLHIDADASGKTADVSRHRAPKQNPIGHFRAIGKDVPNRCEKFDA
jgi:hypothetical protein